MYRNKNNKDVEITVAKEPIEEGAVAVVGESLVRLSEALRAEKIAEITKGPGIFTKFITPP